MFAIVALYFLPDLIKLVEVVRIRDGLFALYRRRQFLFIFLPEDVLGFVGIDLEHIIRLGQQFFLLRAVLQLT